MIKYILSEFVEEQYNLKTTQLSTRVTTKQQNTQKIILIRWIFKNIKLKS